jgi:outer membrane lipoprotein SlyB
MKTKVWLGGLLILSCGCQSMNNTEAGALGGGLFGAALGTVVGAAARNPLAGAAIGAAAGTATGALIGNSEDRREDRMQRRAAVAAANPPMTVFQVRDMAQQHLSDAVIINQIRTTNSTFSLTPDDINWLKQQGVSDYVIMEMQARRPVVIQGPPPYAYQPYYGPAVGVGVGIGPRW